MSCGPFGTSQTATQGIMGIKKIIWANRAIGHSWSGPTQRSRRYVKKRISAKLFKKKMRLFVFKVFGFLLKKSEQRWNLELFSIAISISIKSATSIINLKFKFIQPFQKKDNKFCHLDFFNVSHLWAGQHQWSRRYLHLYLNKDHFYNDFID